MQSFGTSVSRRATLFALVLCVAAVVFGYFAGDSYIDRLPNHAGYHLLPISDAVGAAHVRPRHTAVVVVDGLSLSHAEKFESLRQLRAHGQCRVMEIGPITISRPVYAVLSTGLEQDRSGSRNNDETRPLAAESIWQVARRSGLSVTAVSAEPWWSQLFPDGFDRYRVVPDEQNGFGRVELADLTLIHPLYVDHAGHEFGAASAEYAAAAARADRELSAFLGRLDFERDLVAFTSDHGHASYGGHGGPQPEIAQVLTCFAGRGVARSELVGRMHSQSFAPALALFTGLRFPRHLRALDDDLDVLFELADPAALSPAYLADRRAAVERAREHNRTTLSRWLGPGVEPSWASFYGRERRAQELRLAFGLLVMGGAGAWSLRRREAGARHSARLVLWAALIVGVTLALYVALRKSLDFTSINARWEFIGAALLVCAAGATAGVFSHRFVVRDSRRLLADQLTLVAMTAAAVVLHPLVYGWPLGFPLPGSFTLFLPFLAPVFLIVHALAAAALCVAELSRRSRRSAQGTPWRAD